MNKNKKREHTNSNEKNVFMKGKQIIRKIFEFLHKNYLIIVICSTVVGAFVNALDAWWRSEDINLEQARNIEVELVPHFEKGLSFEDVIRDKGFCLYYDIYFINNNENDISVSDISCVIGNSFKSMEEPSDIESEFKEAMTLAAGSNFYIRESVWCELPYEYLEQMITIENESYGLNYIDNYLQHKFKWREYEVIRYAEDVDQRGVAVYFTTDHDNVDYAVRFNVSYMGMDDEDVYKNLLSIEEGFRIDKQSYER